MEATSRCRAGHQRGAGKNRICPACRREQVIAQVITADKSLPAGQAAATADAIPDANSPDQIAVDPATDTIYVANDGNNTVSVIDGSTNTVTTTVGVGSGPRGIAVDPVTDSVYVVNAGTRTMSVIDGGTKAVIATIGLGFFPGSVAGQSSHGHRLCLQRPQGFGDQRRYERHHDHHQRQRGRRHRC